jgi:hypothetical protein
MPATQARQSRRILVLGDEAMSLAEGMLAFMTARSSLASVDPLPDRAGTTHALAERITRVTVDGVDTPAERSGRRALDRCDPGVAPSAAAGLIGSTPGLWQ